MASEVIVMPLSNINNSVIMVTVDRIAVMVQTDIEPEMASNSSRANEVVGRSGMSGCEVNARSIQTLGRESKDFEPVRRHADRVFELGR